MEEAVKIRGGIRLKGKIAIDGSKNAAVALIPAALLSKSIVVLNNVPKIDDVDNLIELLRFLNVKVQKDQDRLTIDASEIQNTPLLKEQVSLIRASYYFMGVLISLFDEVTIAGPGGCKIGSRPIDIHEYGFRELGIEIEKEENNYILKRENYHGKRIRLPKLSVGATINLMLAAIGAQGTTTIINGAREPEVQAVADLINRMGGVVKGVGTSQIIIEGGHELKGTEHYIIPDRIEAGSYIIFAIALADDVEIININPNHIKALLNLMNRMRVRYQQGLNSIRIFASNPPLGLNVATGPYPNFPTDLQQPLTTLMTIARGSSYILENIYPDRLTHLKELNKMDAGIISRNNLIIISGGKKLKASEISAKDLRGGASLLLAGMIAEGETILRGIRFIKRGYGNFVDKLNAIGAEITLIEVENEEA